MKQFQFPGQTKFYKGKVRDVYTIADSFIVMIASDRISAFDVILPRMIPFKGQVLNQIAAYMLRATRDICPNWLMIALRRLFQSGSDAFHLKLKWWFVVTLPAMRGEHMRPGSENCAESPCLKA